MDRVIALVLKELSFKHEDVSINVHENFVKIFTEANSITINNLTRPPPLVSGMYLPRSRQINFTKSNHETDSIPNISNESSEAPNVSDDSSESSNEIQENYDHPVNTNQSQLPSNYDKIGVKSHDRMTADPSHASIIGTFNVEDYDISKGIYRELDHGFIVKRILPNIIKAIGKLDGIKIRPLNYEECILAINMGLVIGTL